MHSLISISAWVLTALSILLSGWLASRSLWISESHTLGTPRDRSHHWLLRLLRLKSMHKQVVEQGLQKLEMTYTKKDKTSPELLCHSLKCHILDKLVNQWSWRTFWLWKEKYYNFLRKLSLNYYFNQSYFLDNLIFIDQRQVSFLISCKK